MIHDLYKRVRSGEKLIGTWLFLNDVGVAEIVAGAGFDFVVIDMEHSPTGFGDLRGLLMALEHHCSPVVRVKANAPESISAVLDLGPAGIMVPRINTAEQAVLAVQNAKYSPLGSRGYGPYRVSNYTRNLEEVLLHANERQVLWVQIEHRDALANLNEIVRIPGIDAFFLGPGDLSQSMGHLGNTGHPDVTSAMEGALSAILASGHRAGAAFGGAGALQPWIRLGMTLFTVAADFRFVLKGASEAASEARRAVELEEGAKGS